MSEFTPINTQEELDRIIQERLNRQKEKYSDYDAIKNANIELEKQVSALQSTIEESKTGTAEFETQIADLNKKVASYETANLRTKIALQNGIPYDFADRLVGDDEDSLKADAERLSGMFAKQTPPPLKNTEKSSVNEKDSAYKNLLENLNTEGE